MWLLPPWCFYREQLASLPACVLLDHRRDVFVWPHSQMGSRFHLCPIAFPCTAPRWQVLDTERPRAAQWTWRRAPCSAADTAVPPWELSPFEDDYFHQSNSAEPMCDQQKLLGLPSSDTISSWWAKWPPSTWLCTLYVVLFLQLFLHSWCLPDFCDQYFFFFQHSPTFCTIISKWSSQIKARS